MIPRADVFSALLVYGVVFDIHCGTETVKPELEEWRGPRGQSEQAGGEERGPAGLSLEAPLPSLALCFPHNTTFLTAGPDSRTRQKLWPRNCAEGWVEIRVDRGYRYTPQQSTPLASGAGRVLLPVLFYA